MTRHFVLATLLALATPLAAGELQLDTPASIARLLTPYLPDEAANPRKLRAQIGEILATEGYFSPEFTFSEGDDGLHLKLDPGQRTLIAGVTVAIDGPLDAAARTALVDGWKLPVGQPFRQEDWNVAKQDVLAELLATEHADARLVDSTATIDADRYQAELRAHYDAGPRYRFGELRIDGLDR